MAEANDRNNAIIQEFRANSGKVGGSWEGRPLLLLTAIGAKSGQRRTTPMMYLQDGDRYLVFASKGGAPTNPGWYHNLVAHPDVTVEVGAETFEGRAEALTGEERDRLYQKQSALYSQFAGYQSRTSRTIPVVALTRKH